MLTSLKRRLWTYVGRRLANLRNPSMTDGFADAAKVARLGQKVRKLREKVLGIYDWESSPPIDERFSDDGALFRRALQVAREGQPDRALRLLEDNAPRVGRLDELRVVQASIAYERSWDAETRAFLESAVDAANPERATLFWGPVAIISNSYWSRAMSAAGWDSKTLVWEVSHINRREDFDLVVVEVMPPWLVFKDRQELFSYGCLPNFLAFLHIVRYASVTHMPFTGGFLGSLRIWRLEARLLRRAGIKMVLLPFGGDAYVYSRIADSSLRHGLLANYPQLALEESRIQERVTHWQQEADCVICGFGLDGIGRWDVTTLQFCHIDTDAWSPKTTYSDADGLNAPVSVIHTPNHRGYKGTEFLIQVVDKLKAEGIKVHLRLLERVPNSEVRRLMPQCDILAEQFIATAYALSGIEGMACGLPVMANLDAEFYTRIYRRYSFLNQCPVLSTTPETLEANLRLLISQPGLRRELGVAGRSFVEKYHSLSEARHLFGSIYERLVYGREIDLINLYHPLLSVYEKSRPKIQHPLAENRLPESSPYHYK